MMGDYRAAEGFLHRAIGIDFGEGDACITLLALYSEQKRFSERDAVLRMLSGSEDGMSS